MKEFIRMSVGLVGSMGLEVWYAAVMPPRWGTVIVCVFGMVGSGWDGLTCFFGGIEEGW